MSPRTPVLARFLSWSVCFTGPGVLAAINATGAPHMHALDGPGWLVPTSHAHDVLAHLEHAQRRRVDLVDATTGATR